MIGAAGITAAGSIAGGMMSKGGGDTEYIPLTREQRTARAYWRDELAKIQGLQSGILHRGKHQNLKALPTESIRRATSK